MKVLNYKKIKEEGLTLTGTVVAAQELRESETGEDVIFIEKPEIVMKRNLKPYQIDADKEPMVVMFRDRIGIIFQKGPLTRYIGNKISFRIEDITETEEGMVVYASLRMILEERRTKLIKQLEEATKAGKTVPVEVRRLRNNSAYLVAKNRIPLIMRQKDFSSDWTPINKVYKVGDKIDVILDHVSPGNRIFVRLPKLYKSEQMTKEEVSERFQPNMSLEAEVMDVQPNACFVRIAPGLDMLCPVPKDFEPAKGMMVKARISQIRDDGRVRGKIMGEIDADRYVLDCIADDEEMEDLVYED